MGPAESNVGPRQTASANANVIEALSALEAAIGFEREIPAALRELELPVFAINPAMYRKLPYDPLRDFATVSLVGYGNFVLVLHPSVAARNVNELIAIAKASPGKLTMASAGVGNMAHLTGELFMSMTGTRFVHVPYKGGGQAVQETIAGQVPIVMTAISSAAPYHMTGRLRVLAVFADRRSNLLRDVPTAIEQGMAGMVSSSLNVLYGPAGTARGSAPDNAPEEVGCSCFMAVLKTMKSLQGQACPAKISPHRAGAGARGAADE